MTSTGTRTVVTRIRDRAASSPKGVAMREKRLGLWHEITWATYWDTVLDVGHALLALGVQPGDRVAVQSENRPEWLYLDMGAFQGLIECLENPNWAYPIEPLGPSHAGVECNTFTVSGPTCDPADAVGHSVLLPDHVRTGDRLVIRSTGAYSLVYGSSFNGFATPEVITVPSCDS